MVVVLHVATKLLAKLGDGLKGPAVNQLGFQRVEERFHVRVLVRRAAASHALSDTGCDQALTKRDAQKFTAAIAVKHHARLGAPAPQRRHQRTCEHGVSRRREPPGEDPARELIQHHGEVPPPTSHGQIREIAHPHLVDAARRPPSHAIRMLAEPSMGPGRAAIDARGASTPMSHAHQPLDAATTDPAPLRGQRLMDARTPVGSAALLEDHTDLFEDDPVLPLTRTYWSLAPRVIAWARDTEQPTETRHPEPFALFVDEREDIGFRAEVNRMSFFNSACSSSSSAWARWSA